MDEKAYLLEGWDFDLWANEAWLEAVGSMPQPERPLEVLDHIVRAQEIWISRIVEGADPIEGTLSERVKLLHDKWREIVQSADLDRIVSYKNLSGIPQKRQLSAILRHVLDHGTYHRGQLRGLAEMQNWTDFPETGLVLFYMQNGLHE
jgi:uncharacterized damage-inducible protein DinB